MYGTRVFFIFLAMLLIVLDWIVLADTRHLCPQVGRGMCTPNSKFDVLKNSLNGGQLNSILPSVVSIGSLSLIRSHILVLQKSGTYQSREIMPCCQTNSLMASSLVLCRSMVGFMAWLVRLVTDLGWLDFLCIAPPPWLLFGHLCCSPLAFLSLRDKFLTPISDGLSLLVGLLEKKSSLFCLTTMYYSSHGQCTTVLCCTASWSLLSLGVLSSLFGFQLFYCFIFLFSLVSVMSMWTCGTSVPVPVLLYLR